MDARDRALREKLEKMRGMKRQLAAAVSGAARSGTRVARTGPDNSRHRGSEFAQARAPHLPKSAPRNLMEAKTPGVPGAWSLTSATYLRSRGCFDALNETADPTMMDCEERDLFPKHSHEKVVKAEIWHLTFCWMLLKEPIPLF